MGIYGSLRFSWLFLNDKASTQNSQFDLIPVSSEAYL